MSGPRGLLFVPANRPDMLAKACSYGPDALLLDLEDSSKAAFACAWRVSHALGGSDHAKCLLYSYSRSLDLRVLALEHHFLGKK
jgi:citrate lyase beta subunit